MAAGCEYVLETSAVGQNQTLDPKQVNVLINDGTGNERLVDKDPTNGWSYDDDEEDPDAADHELDVWTDDADNEDAAYIPSADAEPPEYDPAETKWKQLDDEYGDTDDDDIEGEEWKYGLEPGDERPEPPWAKEAREEWEKEQAKYDQPDERPRELDWSNRDDRPAINEDDIPF